MEADLSDVVARLESGLLCAENMIWCGNDITVLEYTDKVLLIGPGGSTLELDLGINV